MVECTELKALSKKYFYAAAAFYHYISLAKKKLMKPKTKMHPKSFLYGLRALLCAKWIVAENSAPSVLFDPLVEVYLDAQLKEILSDFLSVKARGSESSDVVIDKRLWCFSEQLEQSFVAGVKAGSNELFDKVLKNIIKNT